MYQNLNSYFICLSIKSEIHISMVIIEKLSCTIFLLYLSPDEDIMPIPKRRFHKYIMLCYYYVCVILPEADLHSQIAN